MPTPQFLIQLVVYLALLLALAWPLGIWLAAVADGRLPRWLKPVVRIEQAIYRLAGADAAEDGSWKRYALAAVAFNVLGVIIVYALQRLQGVLPLNPQAMAAVSPDSAFDTAISFVTNTNWQGYSGEQTMSHLTQMLALTVQNFFSAATGIAVVWALIRGFVARSSGAVGNFWVDATRSTLYVLLPLSIVFALFLVGQGAVQNLDAAHDVTTLEGAKQSIATGPVASQEAIKMLGTNGGGFFNANSAHPYENPTPLSNFVQMLAIFLIPAALVFGFGRAVGDRRQGWALIAAMTAMFVVMAMLVAPQEQAGNPLLAALSHDLRTPLAGLVGLAESLQLTRPALSAEQSELALALRSEALRMSTQVNNLLDMARIESGEVRLRRDWHSIEEIVGSAVRSTTRVLAPRTVATAIAADLPLVECDAVLIERVLVNLLENAAKYTPPSAIVRFSAQVEGALMRVTVADDGPGIRAGQEEAIFEKFTRGARESALSGVGLGLAICKAIVEAHGGTIAVANRAEGGAAFSFSLPLGTPPALDAASDEPVDLAREAAPAVAA